MAAPRVTALVGRGDELALALSVVDSGRHLLLEGPHGSGKSALVAEVCRRRGTQPVVVNSALSLAVSQLVGHHDPAEVLRAGYGPATFLPGPLAQAMAQGRVLYLDEVNRAQADVFGALISAMSEGSVEIPRHGRVDAAPGFVIVAAANRSDQSAVGDIPLAFLDRVVRLVLSYQSRFDEQAIVAQRWPNAGASLIERAIAVTRATRRHPDLARGASVRGALDLVGVAECFGSLRTLGLPRTLQDDGLTSALLTLSSKVAVRPGVNRSAESVIWEIWADHEIATHRSVGDQRLSSGPLSSLANKAEHDTEGAVSDVASGPGWSHAVTERGEGMGEAPPVDAMSGKGGRGNTDESQGLGRRSGSRRDVALATDLALADYVRVGSRGRGTWAALTGASEAVDLAELERLASRIVVRRGQEWSRRVAGSGGRLASVRYNFRSDDLDLDRTVAALVEHPVPQHTDLWVRDRVPRRRGVVLVLDVSGSMRGKRLLEVATAAVAAAITLQADELAVVAFADAAAVIRAPHERLSAYDLARRVLALRPGGLTDLELGLRTGYAQLASMQTPSPSAVVMSDGVHNHGGDPMPVARRYARLSVLATTSSPWRLAHCRELAAAGSGICETYRDLDQLPWALTRLLAA